ncbi:MAG: hypothetical protein Q7J57_08195 [Gemmobacter sp.]|nr:hypothetical protein [Gemmobacter sp.]
MGRVWVDATQVKIGLRLDLAGLLGVGKLATALVDSVPAGQYGRDKWHGQRIS